jgi:predicted dehydrogenase
VIRKDIRGGIIGANANAGWAKLSHIPAINVLPGLKLAAVATRSGECSVSQRPESCFPQAKRCVHCRWIVHRMLRLYLGVQ